MYLPFHLLLWQRPDEELGAGYFDLRKRENAAQRLVKRLTRMGDAVTLEDTAPLAAAA